MRSHAAIPYAQALAVVTRYAAGLAGDPRFKSVALLDGLGRVLGDPVLADRDQPPFARSTRDGFACRADELVAGALRVAGLIKAGETWRGDALAPVQAIEIMTGAPLPPGADAVVMVEHVERTAGAAGDEIRLLSGQRLSGQSLAPGGNYIPAGAEAHAGDTLVAAGTRLGAQQIAAAASAGAATLRVYRRPRVAILATGDELVPVDAQPLPFQIRNSNSYSLAAQVLGLGGEPVIQPTAGDTPQALERAIGQALVAEVDLLVLSGGVSMGKYDLVEDVLAQLGARFFFTGAQIQPGKPVVFGEISGHGAACPLFGLPGNPVSTMVTFTLFVAPVLAALAGESGYAPRMAEARLTEPVPLKPNLRRFVPARLVSDGDAARVTPIRWQGSGDIAGTAQANCLVVVPEAGAVEWLAAGELVGVLLI